jgi:hypothetical protein
MWRLPSARYWSADLVELPRSFWPYINSKIPNTNTTTPAANKNAKMGLTITLLMVLTRGARFDEPFISSMCGLYAQLRYRWWLDRAVVGNTKCALHQTYNAPDRNHNHQRNNTCDHNFFTICSSLCITCSTDVFEETKEEHEHRCSNCNRDKGVEYKTDRRNEVTDWLELLRSSNKRCRQKKCASKEGFLHMK